MDTIEKSKASGWAGVQWKRGPDYRRDLLGFGRPPWIHDAKSPIDRAISIGIGALVKRGIPATGMAVATQLAAQLERAAGRLVQRGSTSDGIVRGTSD